MDIQISNSDLREALDIGVTPPEHSNIVENLRAKYSHQIELLDLHQDHPNPTACLPVALDPEPNTSNSITRPE
jgi:hypothetical protein